MSSSRNSVAERALVELPPEQRAFYRARYLDEESPDATCARLSISAARYDEMQAEVMRALRKMISASHGAASLRGRACQS